MFSLRSTLRILVLLALPALCAAQSPRGLQSSDWLKVRSVGDVQFSPDGSHLAYIVTSRDEPRHNTSQLWIMNLADGKTVHLGSEHEPSSGPEWSPDGQWIAYHGRQDNQSGLFIARADGSSPRFLAPLQGSNVPLPSTGKTVAWSPDGKQIAYVSAVAGPETKDATGDPMVITRYLYKPTAGEGMTRFNDNRRLHIFVVDVASGQSRRLTTGDHYEHSIDWSPNGEEIVFLSNNAPDEDIFFNYDVFAIKVSEGSVRRLCATENAEYRPRWSPDGKTIAYEATKRGLTDRETTMEDTHVWLMNADGSNRHELTGMVDNRQGPPTWSPDGKTVYFTVQERGNVLLDRIPAAGGRPEVVISERGAVRSFSVSKAGKIAYAFAGPDDLDELYIKDAAGTRQLTDLNKGVLAGKEIAPVESFTFISNDNKWEVEAFLTKPLGWRPDGKYPLILNIHGGPHGQQGPEFNFKNQVYAGRGWATLMVNYRGSTGYGQKFTDAVFRDQNGDEGMDVLYGVNAALRRYLWLDPHRQGIEGVSYGGQLSDWLITQTNQFKAAIPIAGISNLISYNYMTYYNQYEAMEWGAYPHQGNLMDLMWERSALKHVANVHTPTMLMHGENDNDVPIAEAEQYYIALKDVGNETIFVRYPREGHGIREPGHIVDSIDRCIAWYEKHFPPAKQ